MCNLLILLYRIFIYICAIELVFTGQIDDNEVKSWVSNFEQNLNGHVSNVLAVNDIENNLKKYSKDLLIAKVNGSSMFSSVHQSVSLRYTDLELAVNAIKSGLESPISPTTASPGPKPLVPPGGPSGGFKAPLPRCCKGAANKYPYNGRFRDGVDLKECYENVDDTLRMVSDSGIAEVFKKNLDYPAITWQYFADDAGHYVQYPSNGRLCDKTFGNLSSPLVQEWFVEKLHMERKNLVILLDNGINTDKLAASGKPETKRQLMKDAIVRSLKTLTDKDKMNLVVSPSKDQATEVLGPCGERLYVATEANKDDLTGLIKTLPVGKGESNLLEGLTRVYQLLAEENNHNPGRFEQRSNIVLIVLDGDSKPFDKEKTPILEMIAKEQEKLNHSVQHFVYTLGKSSDQELIERLAQVADQNNLKLNSSSDVIVKPWPPIPGLVNNNTVVGKEGVLDIVTDPELFPSRVSTYFQRLPPQVDKEMTLIAPLLDPKLGISMTLALPVYNSTTKQVIGVAAVDASVAGVFSEVANFDIGENSYAFLFETNNGKVILHPKLRDPDETQSKDTVFPTLDLIEPDLNSTQIQALHRATNKMKQFDVKVHDIQSLSSGETSLSREPLPATVYYQLISGTRLCVVVVHLLVDGEEVRKQTDQPDKELHAPYHRIDRLYGSPEKNTPGEVCALERHYVSFKESLIKLSPSVFKEPESYKYKEEQMSDIREINKFLMKQGDTGTGLAMIRRDVKSLIQHTLRSTQFLDILWTSTAKDVIERFYGTPTGVFRLYPGIPLPNTYDHLKSEWYIRSLTFPNRTVYHQGKLSWANKQDVIIVSRALTDYSDYGRLQGVVGMTITPRFFTSLLVNGAKDCYESDKTCHIVDDKGIIIDSFLENKPDRHLTTVYPWLADKLRKEGKMKVDWCTGFSDGYHKMTFTLDRVDSSDTTNVEQCLQYKLQYIPETNIHLLVLNNRQTASCDDVALQACSCPPASYNPYYQFRLPRCQYCYGNLGNQCQCQCFCDSDFDQCQDTYNFTGTSFPKQACFYSQIEPSQPEILPKPPGPGIKHCPLPCVVIEDMDVCGNLGHCKVSQESYPTCIWKEDDEYNSSMISYFFPTKGPPTPPPLITTVQVPPGTGPPPLLTTSKASPGIHTKSTKRPPGFVSAKSGSTTSKTTLKAPPGIHTKSTKGPPALMSAKSESVTSKTTPKAPPGIHTKSTQAPPGFVSTGSNLPASPPLGPASAIHPVSGTSTEPTVVTTQGHKRLESKSDSEGGSLGPGGIAAIVIAVIAVALITVFIVIKLYGKKFRRPGADESSKYLHGSSMFDSTLFNNSREQVTIGSAPASTIPYQEM